MPGTTVTGMQILNFSLALALALALELELIYMKESITTTSSSSSEAMEKQATYESLSDLSCIVSMLPAMVYTFTVNHETGQIRFPFVSDYCEEMFGLPASEIQEDSEAFVNLVHPDDVGKFTESVMESMSKLSAWDLKMRFVTKSGNVIRGHGKSSPHQSSIGNADGSVSQLTVWNGILLDISQETNNTSDKELQHDVNVSPSNVEPCFGIDKHGIVQEWNGPMSELTGLDKSEVIHKHYDFLKPESSQTTAPIPFLDDVMANPNLNPNILQQNLQLRAKPEHEQEPGVKYVYATFRKRMISNNEISGIFCTCQDITALKLCEKEKDEAKELLDAEKNLTEWLSHEIRNPLSIAMEASLALKDAYNSNGKSNIKAESLVDESGSSYVDLISQCIVYVVDLLTNVLDLNKCIDGKIVLKPKIWMLREDIISPIIQMMSMPKYSEGKGKQIPIHVYSDEDIKIYVDKLRLKQVITNLLSNAIKFTSKGFIRVSMSKVQNGGGNLDNGDVDTLKITVSDSGPGITPENYDKIFKKWEQFTPTSCGSGIGLCLSRFLVNAMLGTIDFNKDYDSGIEGSPGAQFVVTLPMNAILALDYEGIAMHSVPAYSAVSAAVIASAGSKTTTSDLKRKLSIPPVVDKHKVDINLLLHGKFRLLIVDDDKVIRKIFRRRFSRLFPEGTIDEADSGERAIELTAAAYYDIIFIDQFMGEMNGDEAIRIMRNNGIDSLIVGISANARSETHISAGAEDFFQKPIPSNAIFLERILAHLSPPSCWKVLILDDAKVNLHFLRRKLHKVASAHFISIEISQKHWSITSCMNASEAVKLIKSEWFDLIILDNNLGMDDLKGVQIAKLAREFAKNKKAIIVINSGSGTVSVQSSKISEESSPFDIFWPKPLPSVEQMRQSLCQLLIRP